MDIILLKKCVFLWKPSAKNAMDQPKIERLLRLMMMLSSNNTYSIQYIADRLGVNWRTIYRYLETFKDAGFAVEKVGDYKYRLSTLKSGIADLSNIIYFTDEEAHVVNRLINGLEQDNVFKAGLKEKLKAIYDSTSIATHVDGRSNARTVETLEAAIRGKRAVELKDYVSSFAGQTRSFRVEPFEFTDNFASIWALDISSRKNKRFKIARIGDIVLTDEPWTMEYAHHAEPMDAFHFHGDTEQHVVLAMNNVAKNLMIEEFPLTEKDIHEGEPLIVDGKPDQTWIYDGHVRGVWGIGRFVLGLNRNIEVLEGDELKEFLLANADDIYYMYAPATENEAAPDEGADSE